MGLAETGRDFQPESAKQGALGGVSLGHASDANLASVGCGQDDIVGFDPLELLDQRTRLSLLFIPYSLSAKELRIDVSDD